MLERAPRRLFGREIVLDGPAAPSHIEVPVADATPPSAPAPHIPTGPRTDVLPRLSPPTTPRARLDADLDRRQLAAVLGSVASPPVAASRIESGFVATARPLVGVERLAWAEKAPGLLKGRLAKLAEKAGSLEGRVVRIKDVLAASESRHARTIVGFDKAAGSLEKAAYRAGIAKELAKLVPGDPAASLDRMTAVRQQFVAVQAHAGEAETALRELAPSARETPWALQEVRALQQEAGGARWETARTEATGELLAEMDAGEGLLTETEPEAGETAAAPSAEFEFGEADLARIGTALDPTKPPSQTNWSDHMINTVCDLGRQQGGITDEQGGRNFELARTVLAADDAPGPKELGAADLAAVLKMSGVDLAKVDPNQLQAASSYVSNATSLEDQQQKLRKALDTFQVLEKTGLPKFSRAQMIDELWNVAKVPGHALTKMSDAELTKKFQEVLATVNAGPGQSEIKIGQHKLKLTVGEDGAVKESSCKKPGFFSKVWSGIKKVAPIVLTVASFIPATAPFARAVQGAISLVKAIKAKSIIGFATAGAAIVGAGSAIARGASTVVGTVERVANAVASGLQGVSSLRQGNILGGLASIGSAVAGGIGRGAGATATGLQRFANRLGEVSGRLQSVAQGISAVQSYEAANRAVGAARQALAQAQAAGDARAIAQAQKQLGEAERAKRAAILGGLGTAATIGANSVGKQKPPGPGEPIERGPAASALEASLRAAGRALSGAGDVVRKDWESLGANAIGLAAAVQSGVRPKAPQDPIQRRVDQLVGRGPQVSTLNEASNLADAALSQRQSTRAEAEANQAVKDAEAALKAARLSGDPETILAAQANLSRVRKSREGALMGYIGASDALVQTAASISQERRAARTFATSRDGVVEVLESAEQTAAQAEALGKDLPPDLRGDAKELGGRLTGAQTRFEDRLRKAQGDPQKIDEATRGFLTEQMRVWADLILVEQEALDRAKPRLVPAAATGRPVDPREGAKIQIQSGRDDVKATLEQQFRLRQQISANRFPVPETVIEKAAQGYAAALDRLEALNDSGASDIELRRAQMEVNLARTVFDETRNPRRVASDPPPWLVGVDTFVKEFGKGALAVATLGGTAAIERAYDSGRLNAKSGPADAVLIYLEGVFNGVTFGFGDAFADAYAGQGRDGWSSTGAALVSSLRNVSGYDDLRTIFIDPRATPYDKAQAIATLVAKWAGLAAAGVAGTRYANMPLRNPLARTPAPGAGAAGPAGAEVPGIVAPKSTAPPRVLESKGADVTRPDRVVGSASDPRAINTSIRPSIAEGEAYKAALQRGEIGLQRPAHANAPGTDFLTAVRDPITGQYRIVVTDVKSSTVGRFPAARTGLSPAWLRELQEAVSPGRLNLGNPALEAQIRAALAQGRISIRRITVDYSAAGQGAMKGF